MFSLGGGLTTIDRVDGGKGGKNCQQGVASVDPIQTQGNIVHDCHSIFSAIDEMWEDVSGVIVTSYTLQRTPNTGQS